MDAESEDHLGMTPKQWERFQALTKGFGDQDENGVDLSLLRENLKRTPAQRLARLQSSYKSALEIQRAGKRARN